MRNRLSIFIGLLLILSAFLKCASKTFANSLQANTNLIDYAPYMKVLQDKIKKAWVPPRNSKNLRAIVVFKVNKNGETSNLQIKESSSSKEFDESGLIAVKTASPFDTLPEQSPPSVSIEFTFDYNGLQSILAAPKDVQVDARIPHLRIRSSYFSTIEEFYNLRKWLADNIQSPVSCFWKPKQKQTFSSYTVFLFIVDSIGNIKNKSLIFNNASEDVTNESVFALNSIHINDGPPLQHGNDCAVEFIFHYNYNQPARVYFRLYKDKQYEDTSKIEAFNQSLESYEEYKKAFMDYFEKLAGDGNSTAQLVLAYYYSNENIVSRDKEKTIKYYELAAKNKNNLDSLWSLNSLGNIYAEGDGVEINLEKAFDSYKQAAEKDYVHSQINLARMYYFGDFVKKDLDKAYEWYKKAQLSGNPLADYDIKILEKELF